MSNLQRKQFDLYTRSSGGGRDQFAEDTYTVSSVSPDYTTQVQVHGSADIAHHPTGPESIHAWNEIDQYGDELEQPAPHGEMSPHWPYGESDGQQKLFQEEYQSDHPGKSTVEGLFFDKESRALTVPLLAAAQRDTLLKYGRGLTASGDRSDHSERLMERLSGLGVTEETERTFDNGISFDSDTGSTFQDPRHLGEERDPSVLAQGRRDTRAMIRAARPRKDRSVQQRLDL